MFVAAGLVRLYPAATFAKGGNSDEFSVFLNPIFYSYLTLAVCL